jgi:hypothetical protein
MAILGAIEIQMLADLARLRQDMTQAKAVVGDAARSMQSAVDGVGKAFSLLGVGLSGAAFAAWIKGAINAADEASKTAQKIGLTTDKVAGLQLAFEQSGAGGADTMTKAMAKLSSELLGGNKSLEALGIKTRDTREALGQLADKFAGMSDGTAKTSAAVDIFGAKLGANMIPLLNQGSKGLAEMDELARKLGLTIDTETGQQAEKFNDTLDSIGQAMRGMATQASAALLPSLNAIAGAFLETFTEGGRLQAGVQVLDAGLNILFTTVAGGIEVFNTLGKLIGGFGAAAAQMLGGGGRDGASAALRAMSDDIGKGWSNTANIIKKSWDGSASSVAEKSAEMARQQRLAAEAAAQLEKNLSAQSDAAKKAAAEAKKLADAEKDRISRRGLWELRRQDEAEAAAEKAAQDAIKAENDLMSARGLAALRRQDEAEAAADRVAKEYADAMKKADDKILADWQQTVDQMAQSLSDALMTGGKNLAGYLQGLFRTLVLRPLLMPSATALSSFISGPASAAGGSGGASGRMFGGAGNLLGSALGVVGTFGSAAGAGFSATLGGAGLGNLLGGAGAMIGQGTVAGVSGGLGLGIGAIAPYAAAAYGLYVLGKKLFGKKLEDSGISGTFSASGFSGQAFDKYSRIIGGDSTKTRPLSSELDAVFDAGALAARASVKSYAQALGLPAEAIAGITQKISFSIKGKSAEEIQAEIQGYVGKYGEALASAYAPALAQFQKAGESLVDTLQRLATLQDFSNTLSDLGGVFARVAGLSVDAREAFIGMAGGMDALGKNALQFVQEYYNRDEIAGIKAAEIKDALASVGITQDVNSREDFRRLVDGTDVNSDTGRAQLAALLNVSSAFTQVADYLTETGTSLSSAAALSPGTGATAALFAPGGQGEQIVAINGVAFWTEAVFNAVNKLTQVVQAGGSVVASGPPEVNGGWTYEPTGGA